MTSKFNLLGRASRGVCLAALALAIGLSATTPTFAQDGGPPVAPRDEGDGPFDRLILRGAYLIDGTGAPAQGPVDIVVEDDRIVEIKVVGAPKLAINPANRPAGEGARELDVSGMYVMPGFVDSHMHLHSEQSGQGVPADYVLKLWLSHGVTSGRTVGGDHGIDWEVGVANQLENNELTGPRLKVYPFFGADADSQITTPDQARRHIRDVKKRGASGVKFLGAPEDIFWAALDETKKQGLKSTAHHAQLNVLHANVLTTSEHGLDSMEHWYGLPEALFDDKLIQRYPNDYIYNDEQNRFGEAGRLWKQGAKPGSNKWNEVMDTLLARDFALSPTFTIYSASRDLMKSAREEWHSTYTMPALWDWYRPNRDAHGSYWFDWTLEDEVEWKNNYKLWMQFVNEYKNKGGKVSIGTDAGFIYSLYGFGYVTEMSMMREAGFSPLEVIYTATTGGAKVLGIDDEVGSVSVGKKADFVIIDENPLANLKVLYGNGVVRLNDETRKVERVGGVRYTIKDGIVYDARELRREIREMVQAEKDRLGIAPGPMPIANAPAEE